MTKPAIIAASAVERWLADMIASGLARSEAQCWRMLGVQPNTGTKLKRDGADLRTALAMRALLHRLDPVA